MKWKTNSKRQLDIEPVSNGIAGYRQHCTEHLSGMGTINTALNYCSKLIRRRYRRIHWKDLWGRNGRECPNRAVKMMMTACFRLIIGPSPEIFQPVVSSACIFMNIINYISCMQMCLFCLPLKFRCLRYVVNSLLLIRSLYKLHRFLSLSKTPSFLALPDYVLFFSVKTFILSQQGSFNVHVLRSYRVVLHVYGFRNCFKT